MPQSSTAIVARYRSPKRRWDANGVATFWASLHCYCRLPTATADCHCLWSSAKVCGGIGVRQAVRLASQKGPGASLRRRGADKSPAPRTPRFTPPGAPIRL